MCDLSKRIHLQRIRPCTRIDRSPWCWDSRRCCCTCVSHSNTHPGLKRNNVQKQLHCCKCKLIHPNIEDNVSSININKSKAIAKSTGLPFTILHTSSFILNGHYIFYHLLVHSRSSALPVHLRPLPIHPGAQLHLKLPAVLVQVACLSQLWAPISHSLISDNERTKKQCKEK